MIKQFISKNTGKHKCICGCGTVIKIQKHHKYVGIPKYIKGHNKKETRRRYNYYDDMQSIAEKQGYETIDDAIIGLYSTIQSTNIVGNIFGVTGNTIINHLKRLGVEIRGRGGDVRCVNV